MNVTKNGKETNRNSEIRNWSSWIDDVFNTSQFPTVFSENYQTGFSSPKVNIRESKDDYFVDMAVPGMKKEDFTIDLDNDVLNISSENKVDNETTEENFTRREFGYASFKRTFTLPDSIDEGKIKAKYEDGILSIQLPKREEAKPKPARTIEIL